MNRISAIGAILAAYALADEQDLQLGSVLKQIYSPSESLDLIIDEA